MKRTGVDSFQSWIIALGCCFINTLMFGMARLSGVLFVASVPRFGITREEASFPYTLSQAVRNTAGPLVGYLGHKFGVRLITSIGCILAAAGIGCCYFAENIQLITVLWGVIFGLGFGLGSILLPVAINQHFNKKRATASGISFSGACIGSFVLPSVVEYLINNYGLSQTFLFLSGFVLNCLPVALLLRRPNFTHNKNDEKQSITGGKKVKLYTVDEPAAEVESKGNLVTLGERKADVSLNYEDLLSSKPTKGNEEHKPDVQSKLKDDPAKSGMRPQWINRDPVTITKAFSTESVKTPMREDDNHARSYEYPAYTNKMYQGKMEEGSLVHKHPSHNMPSEVPAQKSALDSFAVIFDPVFILIAVTNALYSSMFVCMITILVDFAKDIEVGEANEKFIIMSLSVGDLVGRLCLGWVTDDGHMTRSNFAAACFFFQGVTTIVIVWSTGFVMLVIMSALYGLSEAGIMIIFPLLIAEFIAEEKQTVAIPTSYFLSGPLCLTVAPLIGFFREGFGSYDYIFYGIGILSFVCTLTWLMVPCIARRRRQR